MSDAMARIAFVGFGEAAGCFARDLQAAGIGDLRAFDIAFADPESRQARAARIAGIPAARAIGDAISGADLVISAVTAGAALEAAAAIAQVLPRGTLVLDINSVAPGTKAAAAAEIEAAGGHYVEAAVMAPVPPHGLRVPMLLGGPHGEAFLRRTAGWPLAARCFSPEIGQASAVKMCRSIMIKGVEALMLECALTAARYGVVDEVTGSLGESFAGRDWSAKARYLISRTLIHGRRRAEEMQEVVKTVESAGCDAVMTPAIVAKQQWAAGLGDRLGHERADAGDLSTLLAALAPLLEPGAAAAEAEDRAVVAGQH